MNDDPGTGSEGAPLEIDDRSPAERWADAGRTGVDRVRGMIDDARLDVAALVWMMLVLAITATQVYAAVRASGFGDGLGGSTDWWIKAQLLAGSGGILLVFGSLIGTALAALATLSESNSARLAFRLAVAGGTWAVFAGLLGVLVSFHEATSSSFAFAPNGAEGKILAAVGYLCSAGLGAVVAVVAGRIDPDPAGE